MKVSYRGAIVALIFAVVPIAGTSCGRTAADPKTISGGTEALGGDSTLGGNTGSGGNSTLGGNTGSGGNGSKSGSGSSGGTGGSQSSRPTTVISPRVPADHRPVASSCLGVNSPPDPNRSSSSPGSCARHADCTAGINGKCVNGTAGAAIYAFWCVYDQCATDVDCDAGHVCYCAGTAARCLSVGNCRTDADCGGGSRRYCSPSMGPDCAGYHVIDSYYCHTPADSCIDNSDCTGTDYCNFDAYSNSWKCTATNNLCTIG